MAKDTEDREDLLRDGTQFPRRLELELFEQALQVDDAHVTTVFCGFRENGAFSVYWGQDTVIQFNTSGELRRAFWQDQMIATYKHHPHWLKSEGTGRVRLSRVPFTNDESRELNCLADEVLQSLTAALEGCGDDGRAKIKGQFPQDVDVATDVRQWLAARRTGSKGIEYALHPGVGK